MYRDNDAAVNNFESTMQNDINKKRNQSIDADLNDMLFGVSNQSERKWFENSGGRKDQF